MRLKMRWKKSSLLLLVLALACGEEKYSPKPRGYFRIDLPEKKYELLGTDCPYTFEKNVNAQWVDKGRECWGDVYYPSLKARLQLTYKKVSETTLDTLLEDGRNLAYKHTVKADGIREKLFTSPEKEVYGILYKIQGEAATSTQFFMTDSTRHFLRGVLYFYAEPNEDSLKPVNDFMYDEVIRLVETLQWQNS